MFGIPMVPRVVSGGCGEVTATRTIRYSRKTDRIGIECKKALQGIFQHLALLKWIAKSGLFILKQLIVVSPTA